VKASDPRTLDDVLNPKVETIRSVALPSQPSRPEATVDGFSFATHSLGSSPRRRLGFWFKIVAWVFLGWAALGLIAQAVTMMFSFFYS